jgi:hypothetical protein
MADSSSSASSASSHSHSSFEALRAAQDQAIHRMGDAWRLFTRAAGVLPVPGAKDAGQYLQQLMDGATSLVAATTGPVRRLTEAQKELADRLDRWGDMQSEMADMTKAIASQQRVVAEVLTQVLLPIEAARVSLSPENTDDEPKARSSRSKGKSSGS